jgi:hypothetical protein
MGLPLANSPADVVRYVLIALGLGTLPPANPVEGTWPISANQELNSPDGVVVIYDTTGNKDARSMIDGEVTEHPGIQIRVREDTDLAAQTQAELIKVAVDQQVAGYNVQILNGLTNVVHNFTVMNISRSGNPIQVGNESPTSRRRLYTINATVTVVQTS